MTQKRIDPIRFVCTPEQVLELLELGIVPASYFCFQLETGVPEWQFAGEYFDQEPVMPAWTLEEINVLIGGYFAKPDMPDGTEWTANRNMLHYLLHLQNSVKSFTNGAQAAAAFLIFLLKNKHITAAQANERLEAFMTGTHYNPIESDNFPKEKI